MVESERPPVVVIANALTAYCSDVVHGLVDAGLPPALVLLGSRAERLLFSVDSLRAAGRQIGWVDTGRRVLGRLLNQSPSPTARPIEPLRLRVERYDRINEGRMVAKLLHLGRPLVVLAGAGIVDRSVILAARGGCVNGHPALLPGVRGVDVMDWGILEGRPLGVSAHLVILQVDAGPILRTREVAPLPGEGYDGFGARLVRAQAENLVAAVSELLSKQASPVPNDLERSVLRFRIGSADHERARRCFVQRFGQ